MTRKNLAEAAAEILGANLASKKPGQDKMNELKQGSSEINPPGQTGNPEEILNGPMNPAKAGVDKVANATHKNTPPGATPPVSAEPSKGKLQEDEEKNEETVTETSENNEEVKTEEKEAASEEVTTEDAAVEEEKSVEETVKEMVSENPVNVQEHVSALFSGENLTEEFKKKATTLYEAAVTAKAVEVATKLCESFKEKIEKDSEEKIEAMMESLEEKVDGYLNFMVEGWVSENEVNIEKGLRTELTEEFIADMRKVMIAHNIDIPTEKVDLAEELTKKVEELEKKLNEEVSRGVEVNKKLNEYKKVEALNTVCEGLTDTQKQKIKSLSESVTFTSLEDFKSNIKTLRESYFPANVTKTENTLEEGVEVVAETSSVKSNNPDDALVEQVLKTLKKKNS